MEEDAFMNILFYHPSSGSDGFPEPPLGLAYLMQVAQTRGCKYEIYDQDHHSKFLRLDEMLEGFTPDVIAVSFMTPQYGEAGRAVGRFRDRFSHARIIVGGPHATALPRQTLEEMTEVDYLCRGEGERTFGDFLRYLNGEIGLEAVDGLYYRSGDRISANAPRPLIPGEELDNYGIEWQKLLEHGPYVSKLSYRNTAVPVFPVITARGCPFQCTFCDEGNIWQRKVRMRSIDKVVEEIEFLAGRYGAEYLNILDDTFTLKKSRVFEFCERIKPLGLHFRITSTVKGVDEQILARLREAGCDLVAYGVESGDPDVLRIMKKRQSLDDVRRAFRLTREAGILSYALCMVGNIGETRPAVEKTAKLLDEIKPDLASCSIMTPYPGSENYRTCKQNGWIVHQQWEHWTPSLLKTKRYRLVARTDKMDGPEILAAYYYLNRSILFNRFRYKYGRLFLLNARFYLLEVLPRARGIGVKGFLHHFGRLLGSFRLPPGNSQTLRESGPCPLCGGRRYRTFKGELMRCLHCGLTLDKKIWNESANAEHEEEWFEEEPFVRSFWVKTFEWLNNRRTWKRIEKYAARGARSLEIGVGTGALLSCMKSKGIQVEGCDLSKSVSRRVRDRYGVTMHNCPVSDLPEAAVYDVVVMNHVLEHVNDPVAFLSEVRKRLKEGGVVHIAVPNVASWEARLPGCTSYEPYHLAYFTPQTLRKTVHKAGFTVTRQCTHDSFSGWFLAILRTLLKTYKRTAEARRARRASGTLTWKEHAYRLAMITSGLILLPLRFLQSKLGYGDEAVIIAKRCRRQVHFSYNARIHGSHAPTSRNRRNPDLQRRA